MLRDIVSIDERLCIGCGDCVPACAEGAIQIINGKAKLTSDTLCDGLGACLGHCRQGAIKLERREAPSFDEAAVQRHIHGDAPQDTRQPRHVAPIVRSQSSSAGPNGRAGCPSSRLAAFASSQGQGEGGGRDDDGTDGVNAGGRTALSHWPVQLRLLPSTAPFLSGARLLIAADCVPVAYPGFHSDLLRDRAVMIACPKLDGLQADVAKIAETLGNNDLEDVTVAHMEVPCCTGILNAVLEARNRAACDITVNEVVIGIQGQVLARRRIPPESAAAM